jgi:hypothetical protein
MNDNELSTILKGAPVPPSPMTAADLLREGRRSSGNVPLQAIAALVLLGGALAIGLSSGGDGLTEGPSSSLIDAEASRDDGLHMRGVGNDAELGFSWAIEGQSGLLDKAEVVSLDQQIIFLARTAAPGYLCIDEEVAEQEWERVFPPEGEAWKVDSGEHHIEREGRVQSFVTEAGVGLRRYRLAFHPHAADCRGSRTYRLVELLWTTP